MGVYTIAGGKGGVGKTTTAASIALALTDAGESVAIVDADLSMANLATFMGVEADQGIHQVLAGNADLADVLVETDDGITIVPGDHGLDLVSEADPAKMRDVVAPLAHEHDVVLIDTGAGLDHETLVTTGLADGVVLTTTPRREAVADVAKTVEFVEHADADVVGAVVTRATEETDPGAIAAELGVPLLGVVPEDETLGDAPATHGEAGIAYESLTASLNEATGRRAPAVGAPAAVDWTPDATPEPADPAGPAVATDGGSAQSGGLFSKIKSIFA